VVSDGVRLRTSVSASALDLFNGVAVPSTPCGLGTLSLRSGDNTVVLAASYAFTPVSAVLRHGALPVGEGAPVQGGSDGRGGERLVPEPGQHVVAGHQNANPGWQATQGGTDVAPVVVDGWRQGWSTSGAPTAVVASFAPGTTYRWALFGGATAVLALLVLLLVGRRRREDAPPVVGERPLPAFVILALAPVVGATLAGPGGLLVAVAAGVVVGLVHRVHPASARGLVTALLLPAFGVYAFVPWGDGDGWAGNLAWPSYVVVACVSGLLVLIAGDSRRRSRPLRRSAGSSTTRYRTSAATRDSASVRAQTRSP
jgi:arabinofuranan 3-O-arabinosyltransferase